LKNIENGLIKGLWNYGQDLLVVENIEGRIILLDFPSKQRAIEYLCDHFRALKVPLRAFKNIRKATKKDIEKFNLQLKKPTSPKKTKHKMVEESVIDRYHKDMEKEYFKYFLEENY
jgi:hypothetical protein